MKVLKQLGFGILDLLYPPQCALCQCPSPESVCGNCLSKCLPFGAALTFEDSPLSDLNAVFLYEGPASDAVKALKYGRATSLAPMLSQLVSRVNPTEPDLIVPVPIHWLRRHVRGFNQAELLCLSFPKSKLQPAALRRVRWTSPQAHLSNVQRSKNVIGAFQAAAMVHGKSVLLVDDVKTTGSTLFECARTLVEAGAQEVRAITLAAVR